MPHGYTGEGWGLHGDHGDEDFVREWYGNEGRDRGRRSAMTRDDERYRSRDWDEARQGRRQFAAGERSGLIRDRFGNEGRQGPYDRDPQRGMFGWPGDFRREDQPFSSRQDDHYRSWRDKQVEALDRDYQDYCREREQQFHQDFDSWRQSRQSRPMAETSAAVQERSDELTLTSANEVETGAERTGRSRPRS